MNDGIINFSDFLKENKNSIENSIKIEDKIIEENSIVVEDKVIEENISSDSNFQDIDESKEIIEEFSSKDNDDRYKVFKDKDEMFSCNIELEGVSIENTKVRLVLETKNWNLVFNGDIDSNGRVTIPIKKLSILDELSSGKIKMEVIAEDNIFIPWEQDFVVKVSKKVMVRFDENRSIPSSKSRPSVKIIK